MYFRTYEERFQTKFSLKGKAAQTSTFWGLVQTKFHLKEKATQPTTFWRIVLNQRPHNSVYNIRDMELEFQNMLSFTRSGPLQTEYYLEYFVSEVSTHPTTLARILKSGVTLVHIYSRNKSDKEDCLFLFLIHDI